MDFFNFFLNYLMIICGGGFAFLTFILLKIDEKPNFTNIKFEKNNFVNLFLAILFYFICFVALYKKIYYNKQKISFKNKEEMIELKYGFEKNFKKERDEVKGLLINDDE